LSSFWVTDDFWTSTDYIWWIHSFLVLERVAKCHQVWQYPFWNNTRA
jgi:hypothetical protein